MGLDQYIYRKRDGETVHELDYRKFPALHGYMQEHSNNQVFDKQYDIFVRGTITLDTLNELKELALSIIEKRASVELMPMSFGPFFGSDEYDEYFLEDVEDLYEHLCEFIPLHQDGDEYEYDTWW